MFEDLSANERKQAYEESFTGSEIVKRNYGCALRSTYLSKILEQKCRVKNLFELTDLEVLWDIYSYVNIDDYNIHAHRAYSAAIMKYIKLLNNGQKYGKRIDYNIKRGPKKK